MQIHVIDINDQIPIFEKSDVSIFNTIFDVPITIDTVEHMCNVYRMPVGNQPFTEQVIEQSVSENKGKVLLQSLHIRSIYTVDSGTDS